MNFHCHRVYLDPAYIGQFWLTYHINVEFDFEIEKWMYSTGETRFQYQQGYLICNSSYDLILDINECGMNLTVAWIFTCNS